MKLLAVVVLTVMLLGTPPTTAFNACSCDAVEGSRAICIDKDSDMAPALKERRRAGAPSRADTSARRGADGAASPAHEHESEVCRLRR